MGLCLCSFCVSRSGDWGEKVLKESSCLLRPPPPRGEKAGSPSEDQLCRGPDGNRPPTGKPAAGVADGP